MFLSPSMIRCKTLPNSCNSFGALASAAIFCADLMYSFVSGGLSRGSFCFYYSGETISSNGSSLGRSLFTTSHNISSSTRI
jgi:hypothetical protein